MTVAAAIFDKIVATTPEQVALVEKIKVDPVYQKALLQEMGNASLRYFCRNILGYADMNAEHDALCDYLQYDPAPTRLVLMPRGTFKSFIGTIGNTLWLLANSPNMSVLIYSDSTEKAEGFLTDIKNHIHGQVSGSLFKAIYGKWEVDPKRGVWNQSAATIAIRKSASREASIETAGLETSKTGKHYAHIKMDDLVTDKNVTTRELMLKVIDVYKNADPLLLRSGRKDIIGTRWDYGDLYGWLISHYKGDKTFSMFHRAAHTADSSKYFFADIGKESLTPDICVSKKKDWGSYKYSCNPYEAPIIMGDFTAKPIGEVKQGDQVIGWEPRPGTRRRTLVRTTVTAVRSQMDKVVKVTLASGREIRCTADHKWWMGRTEIAHNRNEYLPAKVGRTLRFIMEPKLAPLTPALQKTAHWLGGMYDGEGDCIGSIILNQSPYANPDVCKALEDAFKELGYTYSMAEKDTTLTSLGRSTNYYWLNGGIPGKRRFLLECTPVKGYEIQRSILKHGNRFVQEKDRVVKIEPDGEEPVYSLQTDTGNYIAWGYGSKNCLIQNEPVDPETATFKPSDFTFYDRTQLPSGLFITACLDPIPPHEGTRGDDAALTVCGTDHELNIHILDIVRGRLQPSEQIEELFRLHTKWGINSFGVETNAFQKVMRRDIEFRYKEERLKNPNFRFFHIEEFVGSSLPNKELRIRGLQPYHERGALRFPGQSVDTLTGVWAELAYQLIQFPKSAKDDIADSLAGHIPLQRPGTKHNVPKEIPFGSAIWYEREIWYKQQLKEIRYQPRWKRPPMPKLAFS